MMMTDTMMTDTTDTDTPADEEPKPAKGRPFAKGTSGNPAGRPKGARQRLETGFIEALCDDFQEHGVDAIRRCRAEKPESYLTAIVRLLPKHDSLDVHVSKKHEDALRELE